jgi:large subunit ribosomal protein L9
MKVILLEKVHNLGGLGDQVSVKSGYGRNYLIPQEKAVAATSANVAKFEARRAELEKAAAESLASAQTRAAALENKVITIAAKAGEEGRLFGSLGTQDLAAGSLRALGEYEIALQLHADITRTVKVVVVAEA